MNSENQRTSPLLFPSLYRKSGKKRSRIDAFALALKSLRPRSIAGEKSAFPLFFHSCAGFSTDFTRGLLMPYFMSRKGGGCGNFAGFNRGSFQLADGRDRYAVSAGARFPCRHPPSRRE